MAPCYICSSEIDNIVIDSRDNKTCPCSKCNQIIQKCIEAMERRDKRKEKNMILWHSESTGEYSLDNLSEEDLELLEDDDVDEFLDGFHFDTESSEEEYE